MQEIIQFSVMACVFAVIGAAVYGLARILRCKMFLPVLPKPKESTWYALLAVGFSLLMIILITIMAAHWKGARVSEDIEVYEFKHLMPQIIFLFIWVVPAALVMVTRQESLETAGITSRNLWQSLIIGSILALSAFYFQPGGFLGKIVNLRSHHAVAFVYYSFIAFGEEFLFRGFLQTRLVCRCGNAKGWLITAVIFAYGHLPYNMFINGTSFLDAVLASTTLIPIGLLMGFVMLRTRNLIAPLVFHIFVNWVTVFK